jgi:hypothetical protein
MVAALCSEGELSRKKMLLDKTKHNVILLHWNIFVFL